MSTPAQSKIEFTAHLIKISSQIMVIMKESVAPVLFLYKLIFAMCASQNVTAHCIAPPIFVFPEYVLSPTTLHL